MGIPQLLQSIEGILAGPEVTGYSGRARQQQATQALINHRLTNPSARPLEASDYISPGEGCAWHVDLIAFPEESETKEKAHEGVNQGGLSWPFPMAQIGQT